MEAMLPFLETFYANPSSLYRAGRVVRSALDIARGQVAELVNVKPSQVIFTSGGTEANNLAIKGLPTTQNIAVSAIEHPSVLQTAFSLKNINKQVVAEIPVESNGLVEMEAVENQVKNGVELVSIMLANNETGVIQNIEKISDFLKQHQVKIHTDAVQAIGKIPTDFNKTGVHMMSLSSHKIYGPKGCGALIIEDGLVLQPLLSGGGQEFGLRGGTENVAAIIGFGFAAEIARNSLQEKHEKLLNLRDYLESELHTIPGIRIFSEHQKRLPNTVQFGLPETDGEMLLMQLDKKGIAVSSGSACASGGGKASHVLKAMGVDESLAKSAIRISLGYKNTEDEIDILITNLKSMIIK